MFSYVNTNGNVGRAAKSERKLHQGAASPIISLSWKEIDHIVSILAEKVQRDGNPEIIVGIQRGGLIPGVILSHSIGVRHFLPFNISRTTCDRVNAEKIAPRLGRSISSLKVVAAKDILIVDDVVGTGLTLRTVQHIMNMYSPLCVRSLVCVVNRDNWDSANEGEPATSISYIGKEVRGWVMFPWEKDQGHV